ncbi:CAP domain-containing protein [Patescibacteria group bacterium]|nr:CAP domain-containing protein [Patescibacteria group bacterium]
MLKELEDCSQPISVEVAGSSLLNQKKTKTILTALVIAIISGFFLLFLLTPNSAAKNFNEITASELITLTNQERILRRLPALAVNSQLTQAAKNKVIDLLDKQYFSHNSPEGKKFSAWVKEIDYQYAIVGENLAMGFGTSQQIIEAWMASEKHRQNILMQPYREIGIAVAKGKFNGKDTTVIVQYFGATNNKIISEAIWPYQNFSAKTYGLLIKV